MAKNKSFNAAADLNFGIQPISEKKSVSVQETNHQSVPKSDDPENEFKENMDENKNQVTNELKKGIEEKTMTDLISDGQNEINKEEKTISQTLGNIKLIQRPKKENRSIKKTILIKKSTNDKLKKLSEELGTSMNDVINEILEQVFGEA